MRHPKDAGIEWATVLPMRYVVLGISGSGKTTLGRNGIVWWMISTYQQHRQEYPVLLHSDAFSHLTVYRFRKPKDAATWLQAFTAKTVLRTQ